MSAPPEGPVTILIAALGGEGGGVLSSWVVEAATDAGFPVQSTSIPGVAQRTGATTYYIEIFPTPTSALGGRQPVLALTPSPGNIDIMVASEIVEAGRAMQNGYVSPERTTLIASTHRIYAIAEKSAMADGRYDTGRLHQAAEELARRAVLFDMSRLAAQSGSALNAVLFGAIAGSGALPLSRAACEAAIRTSAKAVEANLRGFAAGLARAAGQAGEETPAPTPGPERPDARVRRTFPPETHRILEHGVARLIDYQDAAYAALYLDRLDKILAAERAAGIAAGFKLTAESGRQLALWMSYEDIIRVADLKTRGSRYARVRAEVGAKPTEPVVIVEFLKPGPEELCSVLPRWLARPILAFVRRRGIEPRLHIGMHVATTSVTGFLLMRSLAWLKGWRRRTSRFADEQDLIERWLGAIVRLAAIDPRLALEVAECARLIKGYGETHRRGVGNFLRIFEALIEGAPAGEAMARTETIRRAREAALADPEGRGLARSLASSVPPPSFIPAGSERRAAQAGD